MRGPLSSSPPDGAGAATAGVPPQAQDAAALAQALGALRPRMEALARRILRNPDAAADVVQAAFEKAWRKRAHFRGEARLSTWLHAIVANEARMWLRGEGRRRARGVELSDVRALPTAPEALADPSPSPETSLAAAERSRALRRALGALAPEERDVILRCALGGTSYRLYGRERGIHPAAAKSRAHRARQRLARLLERA